MKRFTDAGFNEFTPYTVSKTGIWVKCPACVGRGVVKANYPDAEFRCTSCGAVKHKDLGNYRLSVHAHCKNCGKYFREDIPEDHKGNAAHVTCPECGTIMSGKIERVHKHNWYFYDVAAENSREPFFGYELWYSGELDGKPVWALNPEHLDYMINYLGAELREKAVPMRHQADHLPKFMKLAKNRGAVVKLLLRMREKG